MQSQRSSLKPARSKSRSAFLIRPADRLQPRASAGFSFAEILAAVLVIAVGLIGIAALYGGGVQTELDSQQRAQAAQLAQTMTDRVRSNAEGRSGYASVVGVLCVTKVKARTPDAAAAQEAACWQDEVERKLPNGTGSITRDLSSMPPTFVIAVSWSAPGTGAASYVIRVPVEPAKAVSGQGTKPAIRAAS